MDRTGLDRTPGRSHSRVGGVDSAEAQVGKQTLAERDADADADAGDDWTPEWEDISHEAVANDESSEELAQEVGDANDEIAALAAALSTEATPEARTTSGQATTARASNNGASAGNTPVERDRNGKRIRRRKVTFRKAQLKSRGRGWVRVVRDVTVLSSDGTQRALKRGETFHFGGVDAKGYCVMYSDKEGKNPPTPEHPEGSTFFGVAHKKYLRLVAKDGSLKPVRTKATRKHGRSRQRGAIGFEKEMQSQPRRITARPLPAHLVHGPGAPMYEYTSVGGGNYVSGAETPASLHRHGEKLGTGYTTGMFRDGATFHDICAQPVTTPIYNSNNKTEQGTASWVFGWVVQHKTKIWAWMLDRLELGGESWKGNVG